MFNDHFRHGERYDLTSKHHGHFRWCMMSSLGLSHTLLYLTWLYHSPFFTGDKQLCSIQRKYPCSYLLLKFPFRSQLIRSQKKYCKKLTYIYDLLYHNNKCFLWKSLYWDWKKKQHISFLIFKLHAKSFMTDPLNIIFDCFGICYYDSVWFIIPHCFILCANKCRRICCCFILSESPPLNLPQYRFY